MTPVRRVPAPTPTPASTPVAPPAGLCVLHLFAHLEPHTDHHALVEVLANVAASGVQVLTFAVLGHKAQVGFLLLDADLWALRHAQTALEGTGLRVTDSFLSITEVSEYADRLPDVAKRHRLYPLLPPDGARVIAFYPMSKRRHTADNWYSLDLDERSRLMHEHGAHGRRHVGKVVQLVTASTGLDDWEWGVTLFAADPAAIKDVVYELRFDEASARYAEFGPFVVGLLCEPVEITSFASPRPAP